MEAATPPRISLVALIANEPSCHTVILWPCLKKMHLMRPPMQQSVEPPVPPVVATGAGLVVVLSALLSIRS